MRVRTYGISRETLSKLTEHVFADFYFKTASSPDVDGTKEVLEVMGKHPDLCRMLIMVTAVCAIGNFDRIDKLERWAEVSEDGKIDNTSLEEFNPEFVV